MTPRIIGIGEVLWDVLPGGRKPGGAPANFALHARSLGANASLISRVGRDALGDEILQRLTRQGLSTGLVQRDEQAGTGTVTVELSDQGIPTYTIHERVAWDYLEATREGLEAVAAADAVCFGSLAQRSERSRSAVRALLANTRPRALRVFDVNLRQGFHTPDILEHSMEVANVLKLNDDELSVLTRQFALEGSVRDRIVALAGRFSLEVVVLTRGAAGSLLWRAGRWSDHRGSDVVIADTVGAGDSFTATLVMGLLRRMDLDEINEWANGVASYVCTQHGATPPLPEWLRAPFLQDP